jgi:hypothetical protein
VTRIGLAPLALAIAACTGAESARPPPPPPPPPPSERAPAQPDTAALLTSMSSLMGIVADPAHVADWAQRIDGGRAPLDGYIDELLGTERFAREIAPSLLFAAFVNVRNYYAAPSAFVLKHPRDPRGALYLRAPCAAAQAVAVHPWWDLDSEVKVCPDSYRPDAWTLAPGEHGYRTAVALSCDSQVGSPELEVSSLCGCGPNLIRCVRDEQHYDRLNRSFMDEIKRTTAYVVEHDLPMASLFTGNATFRDRNAELYYRRQRIGALQIDRVKRELADLESWPEDGMWAPREELRPGQHAGVLTAPQILHWLPDRRQRQRAYYEILWCNLRNSFGATTHKVLELNASGNNLFVHDAWQRLAHTELCTSCHARLDYGAQFFLGFPDSRASTHYNPALQASGEGPLYGRDIRDPRGNAPLTPLGFAELATRQPEFAGCMTRQFTSYALGDRATARDVRAIEEAVEHGRTFKAVMRVALARYAAQWREHARPAGPQVAPVAWPWPGPAGGVAVSPALRARLDQHCAECHDEVPYSDGDDRDNAPFDLTGAELPRALLVTMTDHVAFGVMPKDQALDPREREEVVGLLIDTLWSAESAQREARRYFIGGARGLPAHQIDNALSMIDRVAGARSDLTWGALERGVWSDQSTITPGFVALTALEAMRACLRAGAANAGELERRQGDQRERVSLEDCVDRATSLSVLSRVPAGSFVR